MIKKTIGVLLALAVCGGFSTEAFDKLISNTKPYFSETTLHANGIRQEQAEDEPRREINTGKKMRLEIPAFLTDRPEEVVWHTGYTVSFNRKTKLPNWVAWELTRSRTYGEFTRSDSFEPDPMIRKGHTAEDTDYRRSGYDRGHMCPAADNKYSKRAMTECFYFSNICPQLHSLNGGDWKELEEKCRKWARQYGSIYIACGPIVNSKRPRTIGRNRIVVPDAFYKVVMRKTKDNEATAIGYVFKHGKQNRPLHTYAMSVDEVEKMTGIDFFSKMPKHIQNKMEASYKLQDWR